MAWPLCVRDFGNWSCVLMIHKSPVRNLFRLTVELGSVRGFARRQISLIQKCPAPWLDVAHEFVLNWKGAGFKLQRLAVVKGSARESFLGSMRGGAAS